MRCFAADAAADDVDNGVALLLVVLIVMWLLWIPKNLPGMAQCLGALFSGKEWIFQNHHLQFPKDKPPPFCRPSPSSVATTTPSFAITIPQGSVRVRVWTKV